uniref:NUDIX hydrolase (Modular protein) n=1 Tax=mine drainage metagenome TaxID=410659 RepID=E6QM55_9ZZZZ
MATTKTSKTPKATTKATTAATKKSPAKPAATKKSAAKAATTTLKPKAKSILAKKSLKSPAQKPSKTTATVLDSRVAYQGPLFRVHHDHILEPGGREAHRDVIRHNGSVVILAVDASHGKSKHKKDPWVVIERQYRYAAGQFLWELPAGKLDPGEAPLDGARRELAEETGYTASQWSPLVYYYPSPGFLGEGMHIFLAEGLIAGDAHPEEDEQIDFRLVRLSELLDMIDNDKIVDGKTLVAALLYTRKIGFKRKK